MKIASVADIKARFSALILAYSPRLRNILEAARQRIRAGAGIDHEDFWRDAEDGGNGKRSRGASGKR
jgi:hypothetical protein